MYSAANRSYMSITFNCVMSFCMLDILGLQFLVAFLVIVSVDFSNLFLESYDPELLVVDCGISFSSTYCCLLYEN